MRRKRRRHREWSAGKAGHGDQLPYAANDVVPGGLTSSSGNFSGSAAQPASSSAWPPRSGSHSGSRASLVTSPAGPILASGWLRGSAAAVLPEDSSPRKSGGSSGAISAALPQAALEGKAAEVAARVPGLAPWAAQFLAENTHGWEEVRSCCSQRLGLLKKPAAPAEQGCSACL